MKTRLFFGVVCFALLQVELFQTVIAETITHALPVTVSIDNCTLIDETKDENGTTTEYIYCIEASANCDVPEEHAEMTPSDHTWTLSPAGKEKNTDGYSPQWGFLATFTSSGSHDVTATADISFSLTVGNDTHNYSGNGSTTFTLTISDNVTPQPCPDTCQEDEECEECSGDSCPAPTTASTNSALGGLGVMAFAASSNTRVQNFSHNSGQGEATLDYIINESKPNLAGYDNNYRYNNMFGNGVRFFKPVESPAQPKVINVALNPKPKTPQLITVELMQYGPFLFNEPKTLVFDAKDAKPDVSYRFSIPVDVSTLNSGSYDWQVQITRHYSDGTTDQSIAVGRQEIFNNLNSGLGKGWVFGLMPKLVKSGSDIFFYYRGVHKFNRVKGKWVADKTYDLSDYNLTGDWINGFKMLAKDGSFRVFNTEGQITSETDAAGNTMRYDYNDIGRLAKKALAEGTATEFRYDKDTGYLKDVVAPGNKVTTFTHDDAGRIITVIGPSPDVANLLPPTVTRFTYNADNLITSVTMPNGENTKYDYDHAKRLSMITHPDGRVESFICPITAGIVDTKNGEGTKDKPAKLIPTDSIFGTKIIGDSKTTTKYGIWGYPLEVVDSLGNAIKYKRNSQGQVTEKTQIAVDENDKQVFQTYRYEYDSRGNRVKEILPFDRGVKTWEYDSRTNAVKKFISETGETFIYEIDPRTGNSVKRASFEDEKSAVAYTEEFYTYSPPPATTSSIPGGLLIARIDPAGYATGNAYNLKGKLTENFQYAEGGEIHSATGTGEWKFDKLSPNKRYEIFVTWKKAIGNPARTRFDCYQQDKTEPVYSHTVNQTLEPHKHVYGSLGQNENYQSIGQLTTKNPSFKITATKTDKGAGVVPTATIRLVEIQTLAVFRYNKDDQLIAQSDSTGRKVEHSYDSLNRKIKTVENDTQTTETFFDFAGREQYTKDTFGIVSGKIFDAADRTTEEFYFDPDVKLIDVEIKNNNTKNVAGSINNLKPNKRYEILTSWKANAKNSIAAKLTAKSESNNILTKTIDQTIAAGKHPIAGIDYRSIGIIETKNGTAEITLEADTDVSLTSLKIIEVNSQARYRYDTSGNLIASIDRFGNITRREYDKLDRLTKIISPTLDPKRRESITETVYDIAGNISKQIDPYGYATEHSYNPFGEVVKTIQTDDDRRGTVRKLVTENRRNKFGEIIETINPAGHKTAFKYDIRGRQIETTDALGNVTKTEYDKRGNIVAQIDAAGNKTVNVYNLQGRQIATILPKPSKTEPSSVSRHFYNNGGQLVAMISPDGVVNSLEHDGYGRNVANYKGVLRERPTSVKDGTATFAFNNLLPDDDFVVFISWKKSATPKTVNAKLKYEVDGKSVSKDLGEIDLSKNPERDSRCVQFSKDVYQRFGDSVKLRYDYLTVEVTGDGKDISVYVLRSRPMSQINYNKLGQVESTIDSRENSTVYTYDGFGRQIAAKHSGDEVNCCSGGGYGKTFYNRHYQVFATLSPDDRLTILGYDQLGRQYCSYLGAIVEIKNGEYKFDGLPIDEEFNIYIAQDNLTNENNTDSEKLILGDSTFIKDKTFKTTETTFSAKSKSQTGQVIIVRKLPMKWVEYDFAGRVIASYDEKNDQTLYFYDSLGRLIAVVQPPAGEDNTRLTNEYYFDPAGNLIAQILVPFEKDTLKPIEKKKRITRMEHDAIGRTTKIIQPNPQTYGEGPTTLHEFALSGNLIKKTDPLNNSTTFSYDNLNRKISETNAEGGVTTFEYDSAGRMKSLTDPVGNTTSWLYNLLDKVSRERIVIDGVTNIRYFFYDGAGNIVRKIDRDKRVTEWTFDGLNRHTSEIWYETSKSWLQKTPSKKITTTYNNRGKIESIDDGDSKFIFAYGIFGNEIKQTQNLASLEKPIEFNFATDINGFNTEKIVKIDGKIDHKNKYEVDALNRVSNISQTTNNSETKSVDIQYDNLGQLTTQTRLDSGKPIIVTKNKFDTAGRLFNISHTGNGKTYADYDITWDNANRITDFDFTYLNGPAKKSESKYLYDKTSQIINASYNFMPNEHYDFDLNGNRKQAEIQGQKQTYKTGQYNRLISDENYSYGYDREGNRISKTAKDGTTTKYFWDNRNRLIKVQTPTETIEYIYDYLNRLFQRKQNNTETIFVHDGWQIILKFDNKESKLVHRYLWGTKQDELICDNDKWTLGDHLNTIRDIVKSDGNVVSHFEYNAFGKFISETKNYMPSFAYTGKLFDQTSDLQWNINRWYDSNVGIWISEDPIGFKGKDRNLLRYVANMAITNFDVDGLSYCSYWCPNLCPIVGERNNLVVSNMRFMARIRGNPNAWDAANGAYDAVETLNDILGALGILRGVLGGPARLADAIANYIANTNLSPGDTNAIQQSLERLAINLTNSDMSGGIRIWVRIDFKECQNVNCCINICTRRKWVYTYAWYSHDLGLDSRGNNVTLDNIFDALSTAVEKAVAGQGSDRTDSISLGLSR